MAATIIPRHGTTAGYETAEKNGKIYDDGELLVEEMTDGNLRMKQGDGVNPYSKLKVVYDYAKVKQAEEQGILAAENAQKAALSYQNSLAVQAAVKNDLQTVTEVKVEVAAIKAAADKTLEQCMIFEKAEIGQKLKALKAAVPQSRSAGAESITQGVLFEGNTMAASNGVIYAQAKIPYNIAEPFILPPNGVDLICGLDDPQVSIEKDGDNVKVAGAGKKRAKATLLTGTIDNFMRIAPPQQGMRNVSVDAEELIAAIKRVGYAVSLNPNRPAMTGIYFKAENGKLNLVGCDGSQLAKVEFPYEEDFHFILPNETAKSLAALDLHGQCQITGDHKKAVFSTEDYTLTTSLICGEYMNYESVIPKAGKYDVVFDRDSLLGAATRVKNLMDLKHREPVVLHIDGESCYITSRLTGVEFHEDVLCQGTIPEPMNIAFDDILLLNGISATKGEGIRALLNSSLSPMKIENEGFTALVLPVRMKNRA